MLANDVLGRARGMHGQRRVALVADAVEDEGKAGDMIQVRMRDEDVVDCGQRLQRQVVDAGTGVDQDVAVDQQGCRAQGVAAYAATATENFYAHRLDLVEMMIVATGTDVFVRKFFRGTPCTEFSFFRKRLLSGSGM